MNFMLTFGLVGVLSYCSRCSICWFGGGTCGLKKGAVPLALPLCGSGTGGRDFL